MILNDPNYGQDEGKNIPPLTWRDAAYMAGLVGLVLLAGVWDMHVQAENDRALEVQRAAAVEEYPVQLNTLADLTLCGVEVEIPVQDVTEAAQTAFYRADIPLPPELQNALYEACTLHSVPVSLALGLIEVESNFVSDTDSGISYGLCQLNKRYYPEGLAPEDNIRCGVAHLAEQLERYNGDIPAALRAYNRGFDDGDRTYSNAVLAAAEKWEGGASDGR